MVASPASPNQTVRFFIALLPPLEVQQYATAIKEDFRDRYRSQAALKSPPHITVQPPFTWPVNDQDTLVTAISQFTPQHSPIPIQLSGFGAFPPRVIYIDVAQTPELMALQRDLSLYMADRLQIRDKRSRDRPFCPHLTVAFRDLKPAAFRQAWPEFESRQVSFTFRVSEITLLIHTGQRWVSHTQFPTQP